MQTLSDSAAEALRGEYFAGRDVPTYALLDGAVTRAIVDRLYDDRPAFVCLYSGDLEPDMLEVAPYLVELRDGESFTRWVIANGFGNHWGIVLRSRLDLAQLARHFRKLLWVRDAEGEALYFRYYDPRVLRVYLPTCRGEEVWHWFDPASTYLIEGEEPGILLRACADGQEGVKVDEIRLPTSG